jgi:hypothetical protein
VVTRLLGFYTRAGSGFLLCRLLLLSFYGQLPACSGPGLAARLQAREALGGGRPLKYSGMAAVFRQTMAKEGPFGFYKVSCRLLLLFQGEGSFALGSGYHLTWYQQQRCELCRSQDGLQHVVGKGLQLTGSI